MLVAISLSLHAMAWLFDPGKAFDTLLGLGAGCATAAVINALSGSFREKNKPEK